MKDTILIKGNKFGLTFILDNSVDFTSLKESLFKKLNESKKFFGSSKVSVEFEGRVLTEDEQKELIEIIQTASDLEIICVVDSNIDYKSKKSIEVIPTDKSVPNIITNKLENNSTTSANQGQRTAIFHKGTLRSGQEIVTDNSIVVMGNVHNGATIVSKGNVIVVGKLSGQVHAGKGGNEAAFVVALHMCPTQLRIADVFGRAPDKRLKKVLSVPQIAFIEDEHIVIENINRNIYEHLNIINYY